MTKRDHDRDTKINHGCSYGRRTEYRAERGRVTGRDYIAERAAEMAWRNHPSAIGRDGFLPTLGIGSKYRTVAAYRARVGLPMLVSGR